MKFNCFPKYFIQLSLFVISFDEINCELQVTARCGKPGLPPEAYWWQIPSDRARFDNEQKVKIICKKGEFPIEKGERECRNGRWSGQPLRCGKNIASTVIGLDIYDCKPSVPKLIISQIINQTEDTLTGDRSIHYNAFHSSRVPTGVQISGIGSTCYQWVIRFDQKVQIWFILIDIWYKDDNKTELPTLEPVVNKYRTCSLQQTTLDIDSDIKRVGYHFICDLNSKSDAKSELSDMSDTITAKISTSVEKEIGLDAVLIGDIFTIAYGPKRRLPNCGYFEIRSLGVDLQGDTSRYYVSCNNSFVDMNGTGIELKHKVSNNPKHQLFCNINGEWVGSWPVCWPKVSCDKNEIIDGIDSSVVIEEIGNVYYFNESLWFAMDYTFVRYKCSQENTLLVGKSERVCMKNGKWSHKTPYCTSTEFPKLAIAGILSVVLLVFVFIVFFIFCLHSKRVKRELIETRNEIEETTRKRLSTEVYADIIDDHHQNEKYSYDTAYDTIDENPRYEQQISLNNYNNGQYYVTMINTEQG